MRSLSLIVPASLLVLASSAVAQTDYTLSTQSGTTSRVQVIGPVQPFVFDDSAASWISGAYAMSNGWRLTVDPSSDGIVAQIDKRHPIKLTAVSRDRYVTPDGNIAMEFNRGQLGDEMLMSYVPDPRTAQVVVVSSTTRLAQR
jgi:hypothetical protein